MERSERLAGLSFLLGFTMAYCFIAVPHMNLNMRLASELHQANREIIRESAEIDFANRQMTAWNEYVERLMFRLAANCEDGRPLTNNLPEQPIVARLK